MIAQEEGEGHRLSLPDEGSADFFFDGLLADLLVQSRIKDAQREIDTAIYRVDNILARLRAEQRGNP